jgi:tetratricopeptide (TPR) repeat protein
MGVVYEAIDHERGQRVALKTLLNFTPDALYRFKNEFRTLADVRHHNLVRLYEFVMPDDDLVFFTMELVRGIDFRTYVSRSESREAQGRRVSSAPPTRPSPHGLMSVHEREPVIEAVLGASPADPERLRAALLGLAEGVQALHAAGRLHRDIKPSNVLVTPEGRVVLLDFSVATELDSRIDADHSKAELVGTDRYMAPEQALEGTSSMASDWYSVGVMLYEALVGRPPFVGSPRDVLQKQFVETFPPSTAVAGVPDDIDILCRALLHGDPAMRPSGDEILQHLREKRAGRTSPLLPPAAGDCVFVGREPQLRLLREAFEATRSGRSITVRIAGTLGMGKSTLVQHFLDGLAAAGEAVVLRGRAYERESVPYKAVDSAMDALTRHLMRSSEADTPLALSVDIWALARLFPVLRRVPAIAAAAEGRVGDPRETRRRAFAALRQLLETLGRRKPIVLYIDDVQWGDTDSASLLLDLMRPPRAPPLLLIITYRDGEAQASSFMAELRTRWPADAETRDIAVEPLDANDAERLAVALLESPDEFGQRIAQAAARESGGNPFLIGELMRSGGGPPGVLTIEQMVGQRFERLPEAVQRLLEIIAVGGRPLPVSVVADAARIYDVPEDVVSLAASRRFVRTGLRGGHELVEMSHDRIREAILARLTESSLRAHHARLAHVLESTPGADLEALAVHLRGAGDLDRAAKSAERGAEQAGAKLAFDQAARLYRMALDTIPASSPDRRRLHQRLAQVLEWAGRGAEAAGVYLSAAEGAPALQRVEFERAAAEQLLTSGHIDEGIAVLDRTLESARMRRPGSILVAILWILFYRVWVRIGRFRFKERDPDDVSRGDRARIDILYSVGIGLSLVDTLQGVCAMTRHLLLALHAGDRFQVLRAAAMEVVTRAAAGGPRGKAERQLSAIVQRLSESADDLESRSFALGTNAIALFLRGQWKRALTDQQIAYERFPNNRAGWHANSVLFSIWSLTFLGRINEFRDRHARLLIDAEQRGDLYTTVNLRIGYSNLAWLAVDEVEAARRNVREAMSVWSSRGFHLQHYRAMLAEVNIELYVGEGAKAYDRISVDWLKLRKSLLLLGTQYVRADARFARARAAVASSEQTEKRSERLAEADRLARSLASERMFWTDLLATIIRAGIASTKGNRQDGVRLLRLAIEQARRAEMAIHEAAIRHQLGCLIGGDEGNELVAHAHDAMTTEGIRAPARIAAMLVPGLWRE